MRSKLFLCSWLNNDKFVVLEPTSYELIFKIFLVGDKTKILLVSKNMNALAIKVFGWLKISDFLGMILKTQMYGWA